MIFTQFAERRIFIHLFRYDYGGLCFYFPFIVPPIATASWLSFITEFVDAILEATVGCLMHQQQATGEEGAEMAGNKLTITSPIEFFIEVRLANLGTVPHLFVTLSLFRQLALRTQAPPSAFEGR